MILFDLMADHRDTAAAFDTPASSKVFPVLVQHADTALRAGVRMTLTEYRSLALIERLAFARAGDNIEGQRAQQLGMASSSLLGAALATQGEDDGDAAEEFMLELAHAGAIAAVEGGTSGRS